MESHDAAGQMVGYLYQVLSTLILILDSKNDYNLLCIEKFDDIAFVEEDQPKVMIQIKHQINERGKLNDSSVDLWRSINSWCDTIQELNIDVINTSFVIITTANAPENSVAYFLSGDTKHRDTKKALTQIVTSGNGEQLNLEHCDYPYRLDMNKVTVVVDRECPVPLQQLGSGSNWLGCHLIT
ncbi:MAG: DUF3732 domain-containing protein [Clostridiales bacterium]|nr:DUF3732 domain-containing protein [Clostridiales bacterium]